MSNFHKSYEPILKIFFLEGSTDALNSNQKALRHILSVEYIFKIDLPELAIKYHYLEIFSGNLSTSYDKVYIFMKSLSPK